MNREKLAVILIALCQGMMDLMTLPIFYFYKDVLKIEPAEISVYLVISTLPWVIKPVFGFLSDQYPILGYRRKSYLVLMSLLEIVGVVGIASVASSKFQVAFLSFIQMCGMVGKNVIGGIFL